MARWPTRPSSFVRSGPGVRRRARLHPTLPFSRRRSPRPGRHLPPGARDVPCPATVTPPMEPAGFPAFSRLLPAPERAGFPGFSRVLPTRRSLSPCREAVPGSGGGFVAPAHGRSGPRRREGPLLPLGAVVQCRALSRPAPMCGIRTLGRTLRRSAQIPDRIGEDRPRIGPSCSFPEQDRERFVLPTGICTSQGTVVSRGNRGLSREPWPGRMPRADVPTGRRGRTGPLATEPQLDWPPVARRPRSAMRAPSQFRRLYAGRHAAPAERRFRVHRAHRSHGTGLQGGGAS